MLCLSEYRGSPVYLFDEQKNKTLCVFSIHLWDNGVSCGVNGTMVHARVSYFSQLNKWDLDRYTTDEGTGSVSIKYIVG